MASKIKHLLDVDIITYILGFNFLTTYSHTLTLTQAQYKTDQHEVECAQFVY